MIQGVYNFPDVVKGDTVNVTSFAVTIDAVPLNLTGALISVKFKTSFNSPSILSLSVGSGITVTNASGGIFTINAFTCSFPVGEYVYDIQIVKSGITKTYVKGTLNVLNEVSS